MKSINRLLLAAALLGSSSLAFAQDWHDDHHQDDHGHYDRDHGHDDHGRGGPHHWERGGRYDGPVYVVSDYGHYRLRRPPYGYHWVRGDDNNFLLVAVATGVIMDIATH